MRPGIMSRLPDSCGTQKLWMTSSVRRRTRTVVSVGMYSSLAVTKAGSV